MRTRRPLLLILLLAGCGRSEPREQTPPAPAERLTVTDPGISTPESVVWDSVADEYLVSNINGNPLDKDNNGFISRISPQGKIVALRWIAGGANGVTLHAPKGMALKGDTLFVADIDRVRVFHRTTGAPLASWEIVGATMLNDMAVGPDGTVYVTDTGLKSGPNGFLDSGSDAVYKFELDGKAVAVVKDTSLGRPNGITVGASGITVVTFGSGEVYQLNPSSGGRTNLTKPPKGQLDGVEELADGSLLISSWEGQAVYRLHNGSYARAVDSVPSPADIGYDRKRGTVLIPIFTGNRIEIRPVK